MEIIEKGNFELSVRRIVLQAGHLHYGHDWANDKTAAVFIELNIIQLVSCFKSIRSTAFFASLLMAPAKKPFS